MAKITPLEKKKNIPCFTEIVYSSFVLLLLWGEGLGLIGK